MFANKTIESFDMANTIMFSKKIIVGGQPTIDDLHNMQASGITQIVNLRPENEVIDFDEVALIQQLGMQYHLIPVTEIATFTRKTAEKLLQILALEEPTLVHCASGNRVGALIALAAYWCEGVNAQDALDKGLQAGLTKLAPEVKKLMGL